MDIASCPRRGHVFRYAASGIDPRTCWNKLNPNPLTSQLGREPRLFVISQ